MGFKRSIFSKLDFIFKLFTFFAIGALYLAYAASYVPPETFWPIAFFGLAYPFILTLALVLLIIWAFRRSWYSLFIALSILIGYNNIDKTVGLRLTSSAKRDSATIKVLTYNIHFFRGPENGYEGLSSAGVQKFLKEENPDILCMQEFWTSDKNGNRLMDTIQRILNARKYYFHANVETNGHKVGKTGMIIYSRYPIIHEEWIKLSDSHNQCLVADIRKGNKTFRVYNVHLESIGLRPEEVGRLKTPDVGEKQKIKITHSIGSSLKHAFISRSEQVKIVKNHAELCSFPYIIAGDFNDTPVSFAVHQMSKGMNNSFAEKGSGFSKTYHGRYPNFQIDYILASEEFKVDSYKVGNVSYSDHYPVMAEIKLD